MFEVQGLDQGLVTLDTAALGTGLDAHGFVDGGGCTGRRARRPPDRMERLVSRQLHGTFPSRIR